MSPNRRFLKTVVMTSSGIKYQLFLFNDLVLVGEWDDMFKKYFLFVGRMMTLCTRNIPVFAIDQCVVNDALDSESSKNGIEIIRSDTKIKYLFNAQTPVDKATWLKVLSEFT